MHLYLGLYFLIFTHFQLPEVNDQLNDSPGESGQASFGPTMFPSAPADGLGAAESEGLFQLLYAPTWRIIIAPGSYKRCMPSRNYCPGESQVFWDLIIEAWSSQAFGACTATKPKKPAR